MYVSLDYLSILQTVWNLIETNNELDRLKSLHHLNPKYHFTKVFTVCLHKYFVNLKKILCLNNSNLNQRYNI